MRRQTETDDIIDLLSSEYGIIPDSITAAPTGFSAKAAYRAVGADGNEYYLKIYDKSLPTTRFFVGRIDVYMPALDKLSALPALSGRVLNPVRTRSGAYKAETDSDAYVLFLFVNGFVPGIQGMTHGQTVELAETLALLHEVGEAVPFDTPGLAEDISLSFCERLIQFLDWLNTGYGGLFDIILPHKDMLFSAAEEALRLRDTVRTGCSHLVLCHGDAHGNNLIQSERLVLVDWEDLRIAPPEADLFIYAWHKYGDTLLEAYSVARKGYKINRELLYFYILRRRIEDVWVDIERLIEEAPDEAETAKLLGWVSLGIEEVRKIYQVER